MDSSSITNTNKRKQQQQQQQQQSTTKEEQILPCTNKQTNKQTQQKISLALQKLQVLHQHQILTPILFCLGDYFFCINTIV
jgi:hypothetical protein